MKRSQNSSSLRGGSLPTPVPSFACPAFSFSFSLSAPLAFLPPLLPSDRGESGNMSQDFQYKISKRRNQKDHVDERFLD